LPWIRTWNSEANSSAKRSVACSCFLLGTCRAERGRGGSDKSESLAFPQLAKSFSGPSRAELQIIENLR